MRLKKRGKSGYQQLFESIPVPMWIYDRETLAFLDVNAAAVASYGYSRSEFLAMFLSDIISAVDGCGADQLPDDAPGSSVGKWLCCSKSGAFIEVEITSTAIVWRGKAAGACLVQDISGRRQVEQDLWRSRQILQRVLDSVPQDIFWKDKDSIYLGCNQNFARTAGLQFAHEVAGKTDYDFPWTREQADAYRAFDRRIIESGQSVLHVYETQRQADGKQVWVETSKVPLQDASGQVVGVLGCYEDITERKLVEEALRESEERFRVIFNSAVQFIGLFHPDGTFIDINDTALQFGGANCERIIDTPVWRCNCFEPFPETQKRLHDCFRQAAAGKLTRFEIEARGGKGERIDVGVSFKPLVDKQGRVFQVLGEGRDITDLKRVRKQLERQAERERALNRVVQTIRRSLDLNTIFNTAVVETAQLLHADSVTISRYLMAENVWRTMADFRGSKPVQSVDAGEIPDTENPLAQQLKRREVVRIDHTDQLVDGTKAARVPMHPGSWLVVPLCFETAVWGSLGIARCRNPAPWEDAEVELACAVADQLAIAVQQSELYEKLQRANQDLEYIAHHDKLTGVANRRYFDEYLDNEWRRLARDRAPLCLILCDVDYFKRYNDAFGHLAGDDCLVKIAKSITRAARRPGDFLARFGGEEFVVILPNTDADGAVRVVNAIQDNMRRLNLPHPGSSVAGRVTLSFGIAWTICALDKAVQVLVDQADRALYQAKQGGRNCFRVMHYSSPPV